MKPFEIHGLIVEGSAELHTVAAAAELAAQAGTGMSDAYQELGAVAASRALQGDTPPTTAML